MALREPNFGRFSIYDEFEANERPAGQVRCKADIADILADVTKRTDRAETMQSLELLRAVVSC